IPSRLTASGDGNSKRRPSKERTQSFAPSCSGESCTLTSDSLAAAGRERDGTFQSNQKPHTPRAQNSARIKRFRAWARTSAKRARALAGKARSEKETRCMALIIPLRRATLAPLSAPPTHRPKINEVNFYF